MILISVFAAPRLYLDNQVIVDAHIAKTNDLVQQHIGKGHQLVTEQWTGVSSKVEQFAKDKGLLSKKKAKKAE